MKILLSPAKSIDLTKEVPSAKFSTAHFLPDSSKLISKLKKLSVKKIGTMMHISKDLAELNHSRYNSWEEPINPTDDIRQAIYAFNGEVYRGFDAMSLNEKQLQKAQDSLRIISGLYGILKPLDLIYPYRLEMGTKWEISPKQKNLYKFWGTRISDFLNKEMKKDEVVINLASSEYFKSIDQKSLNHRIITPVFKELKNGEYKIVMTFAKNARGVMARWLINNSIDDPEQIKAFEEHGYAYSEHLSTKDEWVFIR